MSMDYRYKKCPNCGYEDMDIRHCNETGYYSDCLNCGYFERNVKKTGIMDKKRYKERHEFIDEWFEDDPEGSKELYDIYQSNCLNLPDEVKTIKINKW